MTDPASIAEEDYDEHEWYVAKSLPSAFNGYATAYFACTDKNPTNAIRIAHADTHLAAVAIVDALNTADARDADYLDLFAAYHSVKREYSYALSAVDVLKDETMILRELAHCVYMFRDAAGRAEAYPGEHLALKRQLWGAHDRWLRSTQESRAS